LKSTFYLKGYVVCCRIRRFFKTTDWVSWWKAIYSVRFSLGQHFSTMLIGLGPNTLDKVGTESKERQASHSKFRKAGRASDAETTGPLLISRAFFREQQLVRIGLIAGVWKYASISIQFRSPSSVFLPEHEWHCAVAPGKRMIHKTVIILLCGIIWCDINFINTFMISLTSHAIRL
jgi:hypothetical protein